MRGILLWFGGADTIAKSEDRRQETEGTNGITNIEYRISNDEYRRKKSTGAKGRRQKAKRE
jgi:hypothetical protein